MPEVLHIEGETGEAEKRIRFHDRDSQKAKTATVDYHMYVLSPVDVYPWIHLLENKQTIQTSIKNMSWWDTLPESKIIILASCHGRFLEAPTLWNGAMS